MPILACGINHKTAPVAIRERVIFAQEKLSLYLHDLVTEENIPEAVLLSTCNRSELYCQTDDMNKVTEWFCRQHQIPRSILQPLMYFYENEKAVEHIMGVACGLDSMILGESQILGQMKTAFSESCAAGAVQALFNRLFQTVFAVAKEVRNTTAIGACPVSVSSAAVQFLKKTMTSPLKEATVLLIGAGVTVDLVLRHLKQDFPQHVLLANRSKTNAELIAKKFPVQLIALADIAATLRAVDVVITATGGPIPIVTHAMCAGPRKKPLWMIDMAVPRDVEASVKDIEQIYLFTIDDLKNSIQYHFSEREHAAEKAHEVIKQKSQAFMTWVYSLDMVATTIRAYRKQIEDQCSIELSKALKQLDLGRDPVQVLASFANALTNKLLHTPTVQLRQAGSEGRLEILQLAQELFAIREPEAV